MPTLHVIIPVFNEPTTLRPCLERVIDVQLPEGWARSLILVDDCSKDENYHAVQMLVTSLKEENHAITLLRHEINRGKGAALQTAYDHLLRAEPPDDDLIVIQDADLEYDPEDHLKLMEPILGSQADATIGSRWGKHYQNKSLKRKVHSVGNAFLTWMSNRMTGYSLRDMECCYKMIPIAWLRQLRPMLTEERFGIEPQIVAAMSRLGMKLEEVPIHYEPRGPLAGKKIGWRDGIRAIYVIARQRKKTSTPTSHAGKQKP